MINGFSSSGTGLITRRLFSIVVSKYKLTASFKLFLASSFVSPSEATSRFKHGALYPSASLIIKASKTKLEFSISLI